MYKALNNAVLVHTTVRNSVVAALFGHHLAISSAVMEAGGNARLIHIIVDSIGAGNSMLPNKDTEK